MTIDHLARLSLAGVLAAQLTGAPVCRAQSVVQASVTAKPTIVLVHGAFADGSSWERLIPILQRDGYTVVAVQNAMATLAGDVETTKRVLDAQKGPVVAVGHSYGGAVITGAAAGSKNVKALVYIAAFAPEANEPLTAFGAKYPAALGKGLRPDAAGYLYIDPAQFHDLFARDLPVADTRVMAATQRPIQGKIFDQAVPRAAWKTIPSWYLVTQDDQAINPGLERFYAKRMGATTQEIKGSHVPFLTHPADVARLIEQAAAGKR